MLKQRSTMSKGQSFNAKLVRHCFRFWQQSRTLLRHCCWCGRGLRLSNKFVTEHGNRQQLHWLSVTARINDKLCPLAHKTALGDHTQAHCWPTDAGRRNPRSVCNPSVYSRRLRGSETKTEIRRTCVFCRCSATMESTTDRVETVSINRTVQAQTENVSVYSSIRTIWKQPFLNCSVGQIVQGVIQITVALYCTNKDPTTP